MGLLEKIFGTKSDREVKKLKVFLDEVNSYKEWASGLKDEDFKTITNNYKEKLKNGVSPDEFRAEAFALMREACKRVINEFPYDVQIMGARVLDQGRILEMKTGEGKTLTSSIAAYFNALSGKGVHVVTVNDYLASRDASWMGPIYNFMGLSVGCILNNMLNDKRKEEYSKDITYGTNNEFGFDYLRDNMLYRAEDKIQPKHVYCIIDEIDSILIDEARTPLIISAPDADDSKLALVAAKMVPYFKECEKDPQTDDYYKQDMFERDYNFDEKGDFKLDLKNKNVTFTKEGIQKIEKLLIDNKIITGSLYEGTNFEFLHYITQAVKAQYLFKKDVDYLVKDNQVLIVDEFTGRVLEGRRYSEGLHQAIEAKEKIKVLSRNKTLATITIQNFFRMYEKISGMTGTAITEEQEFSSTYNLDVIVIPTNVPVKRKDENDLVFYNESYKLDAILKEIKRVHQTGQPILVGTTSIEKSEKISHMLYKMGIRHNVLNAKNHDREALIIAEAGSKGAVTIATNMAGRGTDIKLGGSIEHFVFKKIPTTSTLEEINACKKEVYNQWLESYNEVKNLGGLYILGTERHESRRIDNQLRGRAGRQGDPGFSRFYLSLDDDLMKIFARDRARNILRRAGMDTPEPLEHRMVSKAIERAQKGVEERNYLIRKHLLEYDDVINLQRNFIYSKRDEIISDDKFYDRLLGCLYDLSEDIVLNKRNINVLSYLSEEEIKNAVLPDEKATDDEKIQAYYKILEDNINRKRELVTEAELSKIMKFQYLRLIDMGWQDHLEELSALRESVSLRGYAQKNPLLEYKVEGAQIFENMIGRVRLMLAEFALRLVFRIQAVDQSQLRGYTATLKKN